MKIKKRTEYILNLLFVIIIISLVFIIKEYSGPSPFDTSKIKNEKFSLQMLSEMGINNEKGLQNYNYSTKTIREFRNAIKNHNFLIFI